MKFCQNDGATLVADDPFKTMVAGQPLNTQDDPLDVPSFDPNKTMVASQQEQADMMAPDPFASLPQPESQPYQSPSDPFSSPSYAEPAPSPFDSPFAAPTQQMSGSQPTQDWSAPPAPTPAWQDQGNFGSNTPFQPPGAGAGEKKGLAIAALVCGIVSIPGICCYVGVLLGPAALIMGFIARNKAKSDPVNFGGEGLALGGMITGAVGSLFAILYIVYIVVILVAMR
jgi:hypothetical protein